MSDLSARVRNQDPRAIARAITAVENGAPEADAILAGLDEQAVEMALVVGITGPPGAGKSTLTGALIRRLRLQGLRLGIVAVDPSSPFSGGALLGDRIRMMDHALDPDVVIRSMASRGRVGGLCATAGAAVRVMAAGGCRVVLIETVGVGQAEMDIVRLADLTVLVLAPGLGDEIQAMKAGILEVADLLVVNKADLAGAEALALDLTGAALRATGAGGARVLKTSATTGAGVEDLMAALFDLDAVRRASGLHREKRGKAREMEVVDWALEMLRPRLARELTERAADFTGDPRRLARELLEGLGLRWNG